MILPCAALKSAGKGEIHEQTPSQRDKRLALCFNATGRTAVDGLLQVPSG